jgi:hypothetical protein
MFVYCVFRKSSHRKVTEKEQEYQVSFPSGATILRYLFCQNSFCVSPSLWVSATYDKV